MIEKIEAIDEFEQKKYREIEKKYLPLFPENLDQFRAEALPIEQLYLSHPSEEFSLRLRETLRNGELVYEATLKDTGIETANGLDRLEIETPISAELYRYYKSLDVPILRKLRAEPTEHIALDWFEDGQTLVESEHPGSWAAFTEKHGLSQNFVDATGDRFTNNEWRAHLEYRRIHDGNETLIVPPEFDSEAAANDIWLHQLRSPRTIATVAGRSGSGKTTMVRNIQSHLELNGVRSIILSTDNYHRGKAWLEQYKGDTWTDWDAPIVYDLATMQQDIERLQRGESIPKRYFDFTTEEPAIDGMIEPTNVTLIEGIYARDKSFDSIAHLRLELPTPLATCIGRRLLRDLKERPQFADPERSLRYILENAEPAYQKQVAL